MRPVLFGLAALTAVGGTAIVVNRDVAPPQDAVPVIDLPAGMAPLVDRKIVPFEIEGKTGAELYASLAAKGPRRGFARYWAYTEWRVDWQYRFREGEGSCAIDVDTLAVQAAITQYLPLWKGFAAAPQPLKSNYDRFRAALNAHEDQHARHGTEAAAEILTALRKLPAAKTCPDIETAADQAGSVLHEKNRARDKTFDARTNGGMDGMPKL